MQEAQSYTKDTGNFLNEIKNINATPEKAILFTPDVVGFHPSILDQAGLVAFTEALDKSKTHKVPPSKLVKMTEFVLKFNYFQFSDKLYQQISGTAIGTNLPVLIHAYLWIKQKVSSCKLLTLRLIQTPDIYIWTHGENSLKHFMMEFNNFNPNIKFTYEFIEANINFVDLNI